MRTVEAAEHPDGAGDEHTAAGDSGGSDGVEGAERATRLWGGRFAAGPAGLFRQGVDQRAARAQPDDAELVQVPGQGRLRHVHAGVTL